MNETTELKTESKTMQPFRFVHAEPKDILNLIKSISGLINEARFKITPYDISLCAMDPANVAMINLKILSSSFVEYDTNNKSFEIALNIGNLYTILKTISNKELLTIKSQDDFKININGFELPLIELEEKQQTKPDLRYPIEILLNKDILSNAIKKADVVAESIKFSALDKTLIFSAKGDLNKYSETIKEDDRTRINKDVNLHAASKYSIEYLKKMVAIKHDEVRIFFNKDYPLLLRYTKIDRWMLEYILAPRVKND